VINCYGSRLRH